MLPQFARPTLYQKRKYYKCLLYSYLPFYVYFVCWKSIFHLKLKRQTFLLYTITDLKLFSGRKRYFQIKSVWVPLSHTTYLERIIKYLIQVHKPFVHFYTAALDICTIVRWLGNRCFGYPQVFQSVVFFTLKINESIRLKYVNREWCILNFIVIVCELCESVQFVVTLYRKIFFL